MTLSGTIRYIERIALMQPSVKMVVPNDIFRLNATPSAEYAVFGWTQGQHSIGADDSYATYSFTFFYVDRLTEDKGNELEIQSVGITVLDNIIRAVAQAGVEVAGSYTFTSFNQRFVDECAGVFCAISLRVPLDSVCEDSYFDFNDDFNDDFNAGGLLRDAARGGVLGPDREYAAPDAGDFYPGGEGGGGGYQPGPGGGGGIVVNIPVKDVTLDGVSVVVNKVAVLPAYPNTLAELLPDEDHNVVTDEQIGVWNGKQDEIQDLDEIRAGAAAGATAYQKPESGIPASDLAPGVIPTVPTDTVKYTPQTLDDAQKAQARTNIGAGTYSKPSSGIPAGDLAPGVIPTIPTEVFIVTYGATTQDEILAAVAGGKMPICKYGSNLYVYAGESSANYSQFTSVLYETAYRIYVRNSTWGGGSYKIYSKPSGGIPASDIANGVIPAAQVNADWDAASGVAQILNKPTIPAAQIQSDWDQADNTAKDYIKNKPTIPAAQVQSDWNEADTTSKAYIQNKPTIPSISGLEATSNKVTALDANSTDTQYPSAKCVYDIIGDIETLLANL